MLFSLSALAVLGVIVVAVRLVHVAHVKLAQAERELAAWRTRTTQAEAEVEAAIDRLDQLHQLRVDDVQRMRDDVRELRENYEQVLRRYEARQATQASRRVH